MTGVARRSRLTSIGRVIARGSLIVIGGGVGSRYPIASPLISQANVRSSVYAMGVVTNARNTGASLTDHRAAQIYRDARWLAYHMARTRAGPPDAPFTLGKPTKIVAPRAGIFPRFARFSSPHLLAGNSV